MSQRTRGARTAGAVVVLAVLSTICFFIIVPIARWLTHNGVIITLTGVIVLIVFGSVLAVGYQRLKRKMRKSRENGIRRHREAERQSEEALRKKEVFEAQQMAAGLTKYRDRQGLELWGSPEDIENWKRLDAEDRKLELAMEKEEVIERLLVRIKTCRHADLEGLTQDQIHQMVDTWKLQVSALLNEGKSADTIITVMCRKR